MATFPSKKIVLLSGPPRCGKDTGGAILQRNFGFSLLKFSAPLKRAIPAFLDEDELTLERYKDVRGHFPDFPTWSYRDFQISLSEAWAKEQLGEDIFGRLAVKAINKCSNTLICFTDCGFQVEVNHLLKVFPPEDICLIHILREGCSFIDDSREWVHHPALTRIVHNTSLDRYEQALLKTISSFLGYTPCIPSEPVYVA